MCCIWNNKCFKLFTLCSKFHIIKFFQNMIRIKKFLIWFDALMGKRNLCKTRTEDELYNTPYNQFSPVLTHVYLAWCLVTAVRYPVTPMSSTLHNTHLTHWFQPIKHVVCFVATKLIYSVTKLIIMWWIAKNILERIWASHFNDHFHHFIINFIINNKNNDSHIWHMITS